MEGELALFWPLGMGGRTVCVPKVERPGHSTRTVQLCFKGLALGFSSTASKLVHVTLPEL